jgi:hypothetical protein
LNKHLARTDDFSVFDVKQSCCVEHDGLRLGLRLNEDSYERLKIKTGQDLSVAMEQEC